MARSYRKTPICGNTTACSEKEDKRIANRTERSRIRQILRSCRDYESLVLPARHEISNVWDFAKDGKHNFGGGCRHVDRDSQYYRKLMRK